MNPLDHLIPRSSVTEWREAVAEQGDTVVFTNGCFDLLHVGHLRYLRAARQMGDLLVVGLNSDRSVQELKGENRPLVSELERAEMLLALDAVDAVVIFDESTPAELIQSIRPDVLVKGGDYDPEATSGPRHIIGGSFVESTGGIVRTVPLVDGRSTSRLASLLG